MHSFQVHMEHSPRNIFSDNNRIKLETNNRKVSGKFTYTGKLSNTFLNGSKRKSQGKL